MGFGVKGLRNRELDRLSHCGGEEPRPTEGELLEGATQQIREELAREFSPMLLAPLPTWRTGACVWYLPGEGMRRAGGD